MLTGVLCRPSARCLCYAPTIYSSRASTNRFRRSAGGVEVGFCCGEVDSVIMVRLGCRRPRFRACLASRAVVRAQHGAARARVGLLARRRGCPIAATPTDFRQAAPRSSRPPGDTTHGGLASAPWIPGEQRSTLISPRCSADHKVMRREVRHLCVVC